MLLGGGVIAKYVAPPPAPGRLRSTLGVVAANIHVVASPSPRDECEAILLVNWPTPGQLRAHGLLKLRAWFVEHPGLYGPQFGRAGNRAHAPRGQAYQGLAAGAPFSFRERTAWHFPLKAWQRS